MVEFNVKKSMSFKLKTEKEIGELSEYQREKYFDEKAQHEKAEAKRIADESVANALKEVDAKIEEAVKQAKEDAKVEADKAVQVVKDEYDKKLESAEKAMKKAGDYNPTNNSKSLTGLLQEQFEAKEDKKQFIKDLFNGKSELEVGNKDMVKTISKPAGGTAPQFIESVWPGHDSMYGRELVMNLATDRDTIKFNQYAVDTAKAGIGGVVEGATKPEFGFTVTPKSEAIIKIAGWVDYTEEMEDDVEGFASEILTEAVLAHADVFDHQFYKGLGNQTTEMNGLWQSAPVQTLPQGGVTTASNVIDRLVAGLTQIRKNHRGSSAFVVAPTVWQDIYLNKDTGNAYTYPILLNAQGVLTLGGVPVYWSNVFADAEGIVGDFGRGARVYTKKGLVLKTSSENKDNFVKNIKTLLVESREATVKRYADGFLKLDFTVTTP